MDSALSRRSSGISSSSLVLWLVGRFADRAARDKCRQIAFWGFVYGLDIQSKQLARPRRRQPLEAERERMSAEEGSRGW